MDREVLRHFGLPFETEPDLARWRRIVEIVRAPEGEVRIAVVGKYTNLLDSYKSLAEALAHGGIANRVKVRLDWVDSEVFEQPNSVQLLDGVNGILVPGGFGERGTLGKIEAVRFARERGRAVSGDLLRDADGGDRGGAESGGAADRVLHGVRAVRGAGGGAADRVGAGATRSSGGGPAASWAARCGWGRSAPCWRRIRWCGRSMVGWRRFPSGTGIGMR